MANRKKIQVVTGDERTIKSILTGYVKIGKVEYRYTCVINTQCTSNSTTTWEIRGKEVEAPDITEEEEEKIFDDMLNLAFGVSTDQPVPVS